MPNLLDPMINQLRELDGITVDIVAVGKYPVKANTKVSDVAFYQNDGTKKDGVQVIEPAHFVEKAAKSKKDWTAIIFRAASKYIDGNEGVVATMGDKIARDIGKFCDRIKTGRLRDSFRAIVNK
jgi:hypothetical protein